MPLPPLIDNPAVEALTQALFAPMLGPAPQPPASQPGETEADAAPSAKRHRRRSGRGGRAAAAPTAAASERDESAPAAGGGEEAWERTHLEQIMFELAREHAAAAERCAKASPPDRQCERTNALLAILMSYFSLEAFISMVGTDRLGGRYRYYDRMSPEGKWVEVTRLAGKTGDTFSEGGRELRGLSTLRAWRNMLTHYKGEYEEVERSDRGAETPTAALLSAENAVRAVEVARTMYRAFYDFDRRSAPRQLIWLNDRPYGSARGKPERAPAQPAAANTAAEPAECAPRESAPPQRTDGSSGGAAAGAAAQTRSTRRRRGRRRTRGGKAPGPDAPL